MYRFPRQELGGAAVIYGFTFVARGVVDAPESVRAALLAHEWRHIARGHSFATLLSLVLLAAYIKATLGTSHPLISITVLGVLATCVLWQVHPTREHEADQVAVQLVGSADLLAALTWSVDHYGGGKPAPAVAARMERLKREGARSS